MAPVAVQTYLVRRVEDGGLVVLEVARREKSPGIARDVREIPRRREVAQSRNAPPGRVFPNAVHD